jgi:hypothetical protein
MSKVASFEDVSWYYVTMVCDSGVFGVYGTDLREVEKRPIGELSVKAGKWTSLSRCILIIADMRRLCKSTLYSTLSRSSSMSPRSHFQGTHVVYLVYIAHP